MLRRAVIMNAALQGTESPKMTASQTDACSSLPRSVSCYRQHICRLNQHVPTLLPQACRT
jgi:hypothetical protein